ncbi:uncharacterized protein LOC143287230 [Babylonia areolata]|uniref:uncharacterized protein LOC143287230 n=1 Tax=Babylonia areolata TaxID=304850 RepID=UPI003FD3E8BF
MLNCCKPVTGVEEDRSSGFIADDSSTPVGASREKERSAAAETTVESPPSAPKDTPVDVEKPGALESSQTEREELKTVESDPTGAEPSTSQPQDSSAAAASVSASPLHDVHEEGSESDGTLLRIAVCRQCPTEPESMESAVERAPAESQADGKPELTRKAEEMSCQEKCLQDNTASVLKQDMDSDASARPALSVRDMEDSDLVLPDLPSMPAGGVGFDDWMAMVSDRSGSVSNPSQLPPARRLDLNDANKPTVLSVGGEEPSPWSMMDARRVSGSTVGVAGKGRGTESPADLWKKQSPGSQASPTEHRSSDPSRIQEEKEDRPQPVQRGPNRPDSSETTQWLEEMNKASQVSATARITLSESEEPATHTAHAEAAHPVHGCQGGERSEQTEARDVLPSHTGAGVESLSSAEARLEGRNLDQKNRDSVTSGGVQHSHQPSGGARPKTTTTAMNQSGAGPKTTTTAMNQSGARPKTTSSAMNRSGLEETADVQHRKKTAAESLEPGAQRATSQRENPSQNPLMAPAPTHVGNHDERCITASPLITQGELKEKEDFEYHLSSFENVKTYIDTDNLTSIFSSVIGPRDQPAEGSEIGDVAGRATASPDAGTHPLDSSRRGTQEAPATHQPHSSGQQRASGGASNPQGHLSSSESRLFQASSAGTGPQKSHSTDSISTSEKSGEPADGKHPEPDRREEEASSQDTASRFGNEAQREATADSVDQTAEDVDEVKEGDIVVIRVSEERLVELQQSFGGTTKGMLRCIGKAGTVSGRTKRGAVCVKFRSLAYRFNPRVLMRVHEHHVGDTVRVRADLDLLKLLNMRVGFRSGLTETLGKVGTVTSIDEEGDLTVDFGQCNFQYSPACCLPAPGATPDTFGVGDTTVSGDNRGGVVPDECHERQKYMQELARMVKEGVSVSHLTVSPGADSSAISRLFEAIKDDNLTLVREMCQSDPSLLNGVHEERQLTTLMYASWKGQLDIVACLLDMGADVNGRLQMSRQIRHHSRYPLTAALESKQEETAALLLERGADPTVTLVNSCATPLHMAGSENLVQIAQILLQMGVDVNAVEKRGATPLMYALMANSRAVADILLHADGLDLTLTDRKGMSPLHIACHENNTSAVEEILLRDQTHVNSLMAEGRYAPLHLAAEVDGVEIVRLMALVGSADVNIRVGGTGEHAQDTPLHRACLKGYYTCVEALLDFGADVNMENKDMETPLHYAMGGSLARDVQGEAELYFLEARVSIACLLIANGAFVDAENSKGRTCMRYGSPEIIGSVQNFIDQNRHLVRKKSGGQGSGQGALRGVALLCGVCQTRMSDIILLPCAHKAVCRDCMDQVTHCPVCKHRADSTTTDDRKGAQFQAIS